MSGLRWRVWAVSGLVTAVLGWAAPLAAEAATTEVVAGGTRFTPPRVEVVMGDSVVWEAADDGHTVTARDGSFDSSGRGIMGEGDRYRFRFRAPGSYAYYCRVHQSRGMQGQIVVLDPSAPTTATGPTPVTAAATTSSTATTATTAPPTTTSRPLATSSTTSRSIATATTAPRGTPAEPQEPPTLNPNTRVVGSSSDSSSSEDLFGAQAARSTDGTGPGLGAVAGIGLLAALGIAAGVVALRARRRSPR